MTKPSPSLLLFSLVSLLAMIAIVPVDFEWTVYLSQHNWKMYSNFMRRTLFEGHLPGGSDPGSLLMLFSLFSYIKSWRKNTTPSHFAWRPYSGFILTSGLIAALGMVHSMKWTVGRARPYMVLKDGFDYTDWYQFGSHFVTDGVFFGSFISGHTGTSCVLMTLAFVFIFGEKRSFKARFLGWSWGAFALIYTFGMGVGRSMSRHHWLSDSLASICLSLMVMHYLFFNILRVPEQVRHFKETNQHLVPIRVWELKMCLRLLPVVLSVMAVVIAIHGIFRPGDRWIAVLVVPGGIGLYYCVGKLSMFYQRVNTYFERN